MQKRSIWGTVLISTVVTACSGGVGLKGDATTADEALAATCAPVWNVATVYLGGDTASLDGVNYKANWWTQGQDPSTHKGPPSSGQPWSVLEACGAAPTPTPGPTPTPTPTPQPGPAPTPTPAPSGFLFSPYKDVTINTNWNTSVISTRVTGSLLPVVDAVPRLGAVTWAFATGECGAETWGGMSPATLAGANVAAWASAGKRYILSTGGAAGSFTCASDAGFAAFLDRYASATLVGVDFDIEAGQGQDVVEALIQRVKVAQSTPKYAHLRFSFTLATLGGSSAQSLGDKGVMVMRAIKNAGLSNYFINLMVMDYGAANASNCVLGANGLCDMGQSAIQAARNLQSFYGVPLSQIELTPMIGGNDTQGETFTLDDVTTVMTFAKANHLAGVHHWSLDRDTDCAAGWASPICNSYGVAGTLGFTNKFSSQL